MYQEAVSPVPTETGYNEQILERVGSIGEREIPYETPDPNGFISNGYDSNNMNGGSVAASPSPCPTSEYNGNGYTGYNDNGSYISTNGNGSTLNGCNENGSSVSGYTSNGYNGNENGSSQFVRRRLLPSIPKGKKQLFLLFPLLFDVLLFNLCR